MVQKFHAKIEKIYSENFDNNPKDNLKTEKYLKKILILKDKIIEDFLKKNATEIYSVIAYIFKKYLGKILEEFINNIDESNEAKILFDSHDTSKKKRIKK